MVRIITDSAADLGPWEYEKLGVACIPLRVCFGETEYQENVDLSKDKFYELLQSGDYPKTSQASPQILLDLFEDARRAGDEAVYITLASALSGTYQSALTAKAMVESDDCYVVDSKNATGGQRMLVEYAARLRDEGKSGKEITAAVEDLREKIVLYACIDTLEYLYRGGRINHTVYKLGTLAQVKPIIRVAEFGRIEVPAKAMGMRKGMELLCKRLELQKPSAEYPIYVMYTANRTNGEILAEKYRAMGFHIPDSRIINVGAAIGSHIGPNACGVVYVEA